MGNDHTPRPDLEGMCCCWLLAVTGFVGLPLVMLLGPRVLGSAW